MPKFNPGRVVVTQGINNSTVAATKLLLRHLDGDWGDLDLSDKRMNERALVEGDDRLFSAYNTEEGKVYVITEWDRSATTVLFASEY